MAKATFRRIGVLTSGGDCAGLNAAIRAVVKRAVHGFSAEVLGILDSTEGLLASPPRVRPLAMEIFSGEVLRSGGTMLGTVNKGDPFRYPMPDGGFADRSDEVVRNLLNLGIEGLIGIGGDGSMKILHALLEKTGLPFIGIPKTIDNDVPFTEFAIGFHTAVGVAVEALDRLQPTAASHHRVMILETMGRDAGHIALSAGIAGGADVILIPEIPYDIERIAARLNEVREVEGRNHVLVVCAEAARPKGGDAVTHDHRYGGIGERLRRDIAAATGADSRVTMLGHVQRGGQPSSFDRVLASAFGVRAVELLMAGQSGRMVAWWDGRVTDVLLADVVGTSKPVYLGGTRVKAARGLGISLGD